MVLNEEQMMVRDMARTFAEDKLKPFAATWDRGHTFPREAIREMGTLGLMGMLVPEEYGGAATDHVTYASALEEIAAGDGSCSTIMSVHNSVACMSILKYGTQDQKQRFLVPLARGTHLGAFCLTEPQAGSDASALKTLARRAADRYVLDGTKQFVTSGSTADTAIVFAVTDPSAGKRGITAFIVPTNTEGYHATRVERKMGQHASDTVQIIFENMEISEDYRLGEEGGGYKIALGSLEGGRIGIASQAVGMARAALEASVSYAKERETFGRKLGNHQAVAFRLADMATRIEASRQLVMHAANLRDAQLPCLQEASMAKLFASEMAEWVCSSAIQIHGGYGYLEDFPLERIYRDVRVCQIYEGASDIQRLLIARQIFGSSFSDVRQEPQSAQSGQ